jgi:adenylate cyclase
MFSTIDRTPALPDELCLDEPRPTAERETITRWTNRYSPSFRNLGVRPSDVAAAAAPASIDIWPERCAVLVVDDFEANRHNFSRLLKLQGHSATVAENGRQALALLGERPFDMVLLDIMMPEMDGYQVLEQIRADPRLRQIPVVVISGVEDMASIVRCIELGAADYMLKPCDPLLLRARVSACLETKRLRDKEQAYLQQIQAEQARSERLLLNILPQPIAERLKHSNKPIAEQFDDVSVLFADIVGFTRLAMRITPAELVGMLNEVFSLFDDLAECYGLEKIKTIGDSYMAAGGLPKPRPHHAAAVADMALDMQRAIAHFSARRNPDGWKGGDELKIRVGISSGPAIAGVIGTKKFIYDLWGDTVNTASRMESHGLPGQIQVCAATYARLRDRYLFEERGEVQVKGKGAMATYLLMGRRE